MFQIMIKEEERLAAVIDDIDHDVRIVPRAAYVKTPTGQVYNNRSFEGTYIQFGHSSIERRKKMKTCSQTQCSLRLPLFSII